MKLLSNFKDSILKLLIALGPLIVVSELFIDKLILTFKLPSFLALNIFILSFFLLPYLVILFWFFFYRTEEREDLISKWGFYLFFVFLLLGIISFYFPNQKILLYIPLLLSILLSITLIVFSYLTNKKKDLSAEVSIKFKKIQSIFWLFYSICLLIGLTYLGKNYNENDIVNSSNNLFIYDTTQFLCKSEELKEIANSKTKCFCIQDSIFGRKFLNDKYGIKPLYGYYSQLSDSVLAERSVWERQKKDVEERWSALISNVIYIGHINLFSALFILLVLWLYYSILNAREVDDKKQEEETELEHLSFIRNVLILTILIILPILKSYEQKREIGGNSFIDILNFFHYVNNSTNTRINNDNWKLIDGDTLIIGNDTLGINILTINEFDEYIKKKLIEKESLQFHSDSQLINDMWTDLVTLHERFNTNTGSFILGTRKKAMDSLKYRSR